MTDDKPPIPNAGAAAPHGAADPGPLVQRAGRDPDAHYEPDPDQGVKVVHQVKPSHVPTHGATDFATRGRTDDAATLDVRATLSQASVWEASPPADGEAA